MFDRETSKELQLHKEESKGQIMSGKENRAGHRVTVKKCINPLDNDVNSLVNIYTEIKVQNSNVNESLNLNEQQHQQFEASWPNRFYNGMKKEVKTMKSGEKCSKSGDIEVFNKGLIYCRVMYLLSIGIITIEVVLKHELSPLPLSLFENTGEMRASTSKSDLKKRSSGDVFMLTTKA